jgi:DNA-directed RNA polymerase specialized sigma24 family protein
MWSSPDKALEYIYDNYYEKLCNLVYRITKDSVVSEDIVQDVFFEIGVKEMKYSLTHHWKLISGDLAEIKH